MQQRPIDDDYEVGYWVRQLHLSGAIVITVTALGGLRIIVDWPTADRLWLIAVGLAIGLQLAVIPLPWARILRRPGARRAVEGWWLLELSLLFAFCLNDAAALALYPAGVMVVVVSAATLFAGPIVLRLGAIAVAGYLGLAWITPRADATLVVAMLAITVIVIGLCARSAVNRDRQDDDRRRVARRTEALLENASDAIVAISPRGEVVYASTSVRRVLGYEPSWLTADRMVAITHPEHLATVHEWMAKLYTASPGHTARIESRTRRADGTWINVEVLGANRLDDPDLGAAVLSIRDTSAQKELEEELTRQAFEDSLTGLPNRALFRDRIEHAVARNQRGGGRITLLLVDLDNFKLVNDSLGHVAGDQLIGTIAVRLHQQVRPADTLARLGGDEFAVLVEDVDELEAAALAQRLLAVIRRPVTLGNRDFVCTASIGVSMAKAVESADRPDTGELLRDADLAMYAAKAAGRDRYAVFDPAMHVDILREADERAELEAALAGHEFVVHYQPIVDLPSSRLTGVEALVRWQHPRRGLVGPSLFIPLAESTGLIVPLGRWVLQQACARVARWHRELPDAADVRLSVNLSARQFQHAGLVDDVAAVLAETGIDPGLVILEITESMLMQDADATVVILHQLRALGVRLAIDDFGTGYSSLSYLKRFPVDILKIDRSFVDGITTDPEDATLAEAVVQMGRALRLQTVAEGIETNDQWSALHTLGCDFGQGFLFAKPAEPELIEALLNGSADSPAGGSLNGPALDVGDPVTPKVLTSGERPISSRPRTP